MQKLTMGVSDLSGPAVDAFAALRDDNDDKEADEAVALRNFERFKESFFKQQRSFFSFVKLRKSR